MGRIIHLHLDIRGALMNWVPHEWDSVIRDDSGRSLSPREAKAVLLDELAKGHVVLPYGPMCEGFDLSGGGCPGHEVADADAIAMIDGGMPS